MSVSNLISGITRTISLMYPRYILMMCVYLFEMFVGYIGTSASLFSFCTRQTTFTKVQFRVTILLILMPILGGSIANAISIDEVIAGVDDRITRASYSASKISTQLVDSTGTNNHSSLVALRDQALLMHQTQVVATETGQSGTDLHDPAKSILVESDAFYERRNGFVVKRLVESDRNTMLANAKVNMAYPHRLAVGQRMVQGVGDGRLFTKSEVKSIRIIEGENGSKVEIIVDATKRSSYETIRYILDPECDWLATFVEYLSGDRVIRRIESEGTWKDGSSGLVMPAQVKFTHLQPDVDLRHKAVKSLIKLEPFDQIGPFYIEGMENAISIEEARLRAVGKVLSSWQSELPLEIDVEQNELTESKQALVSKDTELSNGSQAHESAVASTSVSKEPPVSDAHNFTHDRMAADTRPIIVGGLIVGGFMLMLLLVAIYLQRRLPNSIRFSRSVGLMACISLCMLVISMIGLRSQQYRESLAQELPSNVDGVVIDDFFSSAHCALAVADRPLAQYWGRIVDPQTGGSIRYPGQFVRQDGVEVHHWREGLELKGLRIKGTQGQRFVGNQPEKNTPSTWSPTLYTLAKAHVAAGGMWPPRPVSDTERIRLESPSLGELGDGAPINNMFIETSESEEGNYVFRVYREQELALSVEIYKPEPGQIREHYRYFDTGEVPIFIWEITYQTQSSSDVLSSPDTNMEGVIPR